MRRLLGRAAQLRAVRAALAAGQSVLVIGDAGIGKSALVRAALADVDHREGGALPAMQATRYFPLALALRERLEGDVDDVAARCRTLLGPVILFVDDLHWADEGTLDVLRWLTAEGPVVMTSRTDVGTGHLDPRLVRVMLRPLSERAATRLATRLHPMLDARSRQTLVDTASGCRCSSSGSPPMPGSRRRWSPRSPPA